MRTIELDTLDPDLRERLLDAMSEPVLVTAHDRPVLVIRNLADDETADELIAANPAFLETIRRAREDKEQGRVRRLAELRARYDADERPQADNGTA